MAFDYIDFPKPVFQFALIGLTGQIGCGKDTVANILCETFGFERIGFGDPIREGISAMFDIPVANLNDRSTKEIPCDELLGKTPRFAMQTLGTEWGRNIIDDGIWVKLAERKIIKYQSLGAPGVVITDVRFENEAEWFRNLSKELWHIIRTNNPLEVKSSHASENGISKLSNEIIIENDEDIESLTLKIKKIYNDRIGSRRNI